MDIKEFVHIVLTLHDAQLKHNGIPDFVIHDLVKQTHHTDRTIRLWRDEVQKAIAEEKSLTAPK